MRSRSRIYKRNLWGVGLLLVLASGGCVPAIVTQYSLSNSTDEFTGHSYAMMNNNFLGNVEPGSGNVIDLSFQRFIEAGGPMSYQAFVTWRSDDWMFIEPGESLLFLVDGETHGVESATGSLGDRDVLYGGAVWETAMYEVSADLLQRLAASASVRVRVRGSEHSSEGDFTPENFTRLREFLALYGPKVSP